MKSRCCLCLCVCLYIPPSIFARQRLGRNVTAVTNTHLAIEELLDGSFSVWPVSYEGKWAISSSKKFLLFSVFKFANYIPTLLKHIDMDMVAGIAQLVDPGLRTWIGARFPSGARDFSRLHSAHTGYGAHTAVYPGDTGHFLPESKTAGATHLHLGTRLKMRGAIPPLAHTSSWRRA
jgi:hypothetical protein